MKLLIAAGLLLLCTTYVRAECVVTLSTVSAPSIHLSTDTSKTFTQFKETKTCVEEKIIPISLYLDNLKKSRVTKASEVSSSLVDIDKFDTKISEVEAIKTEVEKPLHKPEPEPKPTPEPIP